MQKGLFFNLPNTRTSKETTKEIVKKANEPAKRTKEKKLVETSVKRNRTDNKFANTLINARANLKPDDSLELVLEEVRLIEYIKKIKVNGICSIDTETTGLDPIMNEVVGVCLFTPGEKAIYVPVRHTDLNNVLIPNQVSVTVVCNLLQELDDLKIKFIFHNAKFDIRFIKNSIGAILHPFWDTALAGNYLNENESHRLKYLWSKYVNKQEETAALNFDELFEGMPFNQVPLDIAYLYAAGDAKKTYELFEFQFTYLNPKSPECEEKRLKECALFLSEVETPLINVLVEMEEEGIGVDLTFANKLDSDYSTRITEIEKRCYEFLSTLDYSGLPTEKATKLSNPINLSSPTQLAIVIYDVMKCKTKDKMKDRGTGEEVLDFLSSDDKYGNFFKDLLSYREVNKLLSTYIKKLPNNVNSKTGRIHASFNQYGAKTGRFSSSDPNLQNIPASDKNIRKMFIPRPGHVLISCDYSQQEPRVLAHVSQDEKLIKAYSENKDLYSWIASEVFKQPYEMCREYDPAGNKNPEGKKRRDAMKSVVLGIMYGRGSLAIADQLGITRNEANKVFEMFYEAFPKAAQYLDNVKKQAKLNGYVQTAWGRKRRLPDIQLNEYEFESVDSSLLEPAVLDYMKTMFKNVNFKEKENLKRKAFDQGIKVIDNGGKIADAERQSVNSIIQGSSADITKAAMLLIGMDKELKMLGAQMVLTVHDEIITQCPYEHALLVKDRIKYLMIKAAAEKISVPMKVDTEITERWYGEELDLQ